MILAKRSKGNVAKHEANCPVVHMIASISPFTGIKPHYLEYFLPFLMQLLFAASETICGCDLTRLACDTNCCCDPDCTPTHMLYFSHCDKQIMGNPLGLCRTERNDDYESHWSPGCLFANNNDELNFASFDEAELNFSAPVSGEKNANFYTPGSPIYVEHSPGEIQEMLVRQEIPGQGCIETTPINEFMTREIHCFEKAIANRS
ncbi:unnamed protein product [Dicrocoelium dendriticum]|nr:unnamed protein product [Dicrocoelium dendriticum]